MARPKKNTDDNTMAISVRVDETQIAEMAKTWLDRGFSPEEWDASSWSARVARLCGFGTAKKSAVKSSIASILEGMRERREGSDETPTDDATETADDATETADAKKGKRGK